MLAGWPTGVLFQGTVALCTVNPAILFMSRDYHKPVSLEVKQLEHQGLYCMEYYLSILH